MLHIDSIHRGAGQILPPMRRCYLVVELTAKPTPQDAMKGVYNYQFILTPINQLMRSIMNDDREECDKMMITLSIVLKDDDKALT
eukprot:7306352-Heterocapsa_arctica.AAC.1